MSARVDGARRAARARWGGVFAASVALTLGAVGLERAGADPLGPSRRCERAVLVDGLIRCDEEIGALAGRVRGGDAVVDGVVVGRMDPALVAAFGQPVDVNTASIAELETLPRIGPVLAGRIAATRPFARVDDLRSVRGVGPKTLARLRPRVVASR